MQGRPARRRSGRTERNPLIMFRLNLIIKSHAQVTAIQKASGEVSADSHESIRLQRLRAQQTGTLFRQELGLESMRSLETVVFEAGGLRSAS